MEEIINQIIIDIKPIIGDINKIEKINVGFTNTIYLINDEYFLKICSNPDNENNFKKEIDFYLVNKDNQYIPELLAYSTNKTKIPYFYELMRKVEGVSLYNVWHTFSDIEREDIIKQLCDLMKLFHSHNQDPYDWSKYLKNKINEHLKLAQEINYFNEEEINLLNQALSKFDEYLESNQFSFVHNDIHFDNVIYHNGAIRIIDFERSIIAPIDFELDIFFRMVRMPGKYASEETEAFTDVEDYKLIPKWVGKYYPEILNIPNLEKRFAIYDLLNFLGHSYKFPHITEIKDHIMNSINIVLK